MSFVQQIVPTSARILEIGAGNSSLWWAHRGNRTTAIEDSAEWASSLVAKASAELVPLEIIEANIDECNPFCLGLDRDFDVLVVDHSGDRPKAIERFLPFLNPNSFVILDNSDRAEYASARELLLTRGYQVVDFFGLGPINAFGTMTSVFFKQALGAKGIHAIFNTVAN